MQKKNLSRAHEIASRGTETETVGTIAIKLWDITSLGSVQFVGFFDVAARLSTVDGPIAALVGGSSCRPSIGSALRHRTFNDYKNNTTVYTLNEHRRRKIRRRCPITSTKAEKCY